MAINLHATATVDVQAQHFQQFLQNFNQFQTNLNKVPGQWQNINRASILATAQMRNATMQMQQSTQATTSNVNSLGAALQRASYNAANLTRRLGGALGIGGRTQTGSGSTGTHPLAGGAPANAAPAAAPAGGGTVPPTVPPPPRNPRGAYGRGRFYERGGGFFGATSFFQRNLGLIGSTLLGGGALYGMGALAGSASADRKFYQGVGSDYGTVKSYELAYNRLFSGKEYLSRIADAQTGVSSDQRTALYTLGVDPTLSTNQAANAALLNLRNRTKGMDPTTLGNYANSNRWTSLFSMQDIRRIAGASDQEFQEQYQKQVDEAARLQLQDESVKAWQDLNDKLKQTSAYLEHDFLDAFKGLTGPIGNLATASGNAAAALLKTESAAYAIAALGSSLDHLARFINAFTKSEQKYDPKNPMPNANNPNSSFTDKLGEALSWYRRIFGGGIGNPGTASGLNTLGGASSGKTIGKWWESAKGSVKGWAGRALDWTMGGVGKGIAGFSNAISGARSAYDNFKIGGGSGAPSFSLATPNLESGDQAILKTLIGLEAGPQGYGSLGKRTPSGDRAYGMYQVMGNNVASWTQKWVGRSMTPDEFLGDPRAQDAVALGQFKEYMQRYGTVVDAMAAWKSGQPYAVSKGWGDPTAGDNVQSYVQKGIGIYNSQPGVTKVDISLYNQTGTGVGTSASTTAVPQGIIINQF